MIEPTTKQMSAPGQIRTFAGLSPYDWLGALSRHRAGPSPLVKTPLFVIPAVIPTGKRPPDGDRENMLTYCFKNGAAGVN